MFNDLASELANSDEYTKFIFATISSEIMSAMVNLNLTDLELKRKKELIDKITDKAQINLEIGEKEELAKLSSFKDFKDFLEYRDKFNLIISNINIKYPILSKLNKDELVLLNTKIFNTEIFKTKLKLYTTTLKSCFVTYISDALTGYVINEVIATFIEYLGGALVACTLAATLASYFTGGYSFELIPTCVRTALLYLGEDEVTANFTKIILMSLLNPVTMYRLRTCVSNWWYGY